tara:strand:- start:701 stop:1087 length:387 start_codon:yes stop_codon:yes gene_type:complete
MELKTLFNVGDTAFLLSNRLCYKVIIKEIDVEVLKDNKVNTSYLVDKIVPRGILKEDIETLEVMEDRLFLSKQDVKDALKQIEEVNELAAKLNDSFPDDIPTAMPGITGGNYNIFPNGLNWDSVTGAY